MNLEPIKLKTSLDHETPTRVQNWGAQLLNCTLKGHQCVWRVSPEGKQTAETTGCVQVTQQEKVLERWAWPTWGVRQHALVTSNTRFRAVHGNEPVVGRWTCIGLRRQRVCGWQGEQSTQLWYEEHMGVFVGTIPQRWPGEIKTETYDVLGRTCGSVAAHTDFLSPSVLNKMCMCEWKKLIAVLSFHTTLGLCVHMQVKYVCVSLGAFCSFTSCVWLWNQASVDSGINRSCICEGTMQTNRFVDILALHV